MQTNFHQILAMINDAIWPLFRISGVLISIPVLSGAVVPARVRVILLICLAMIITPYHLSLPSTDLFSLTGLLIIFQELTLGVIIGFIFEIVFQAFIVGGQIIAMQSGLGFATLIDPASKSSVPLLSQLYLMMVSLVFLALNGHLLVFKFLIASYQHMPIGSLVVDANILWPFLLFSAWIFKGAIMIALPAIVSLLVVNLSFGVMTRAAPQLNIFSIGFPITLTLGVIIIYVTLGSILPHVNSSMSQAFDLLSGLLR